MNAVAIRANFSKAIISTRNDPDFENLPDFSGAMLPKTKFVGARLVGVIMRETNLKNTDFSNAIVTDCDFTGADLTDSNWKKVRRVENCIWKNVIGTSPENFPDYLWKEIQSQNLTPKTKQKKLSKEI